MSHAALVIPTLDRLGGAERQVMLQARGLRRRGWRVTVVTLSGTGGAAALELQDAGIAFLSLRMRKGLADPRGWIRFNRWLGRERPDVVHAHLPHAAWLVRWSRLCAAMTAVFATWLPGTVFPGTVFIDTLHSSSIGPLVRRLGYRFTRWLPDRVTAVSRAVAESHLRAGMVSAERLTVLPNGVDVEQCRPDVAVRSAVRREFGMGDEFLWLAAGRLEPVKDYPTLLRAMTALPCPARLVIAGSGPLMGDLAQLSARLGIEHRVRFLGFETNVKRWMQAADGFVLSSLWEGLPMAVLEAAACALPAVATNVPGTGEAIMDGETGLLAPAADASALARSMTAFMQLPIGKRAAMGARARQHATEQFSLAASLDRWEKLYGELSSRSCLLKREACTRQSASSS